MKLSRTVPALPVQNLEDATVFYRDRLGFTGRDRRGEQRGTVQYQNREFARLVRDEAELHLWAANEVTA